MEITDRDPVSGNDLVDRITIRYPMSSEQTDSRLLQRPTPETVVEPVSKFESASLLSVLPIHMARGVTDTARKVVDEASATTSERLPAWVTISHHAASTAYPLFKAPTATCVLHTTTLKECVTHSAFPGIILRDITLVI